jgi:hypothetical protein
LVALEEQLIEFPKGAHDDIIDAMAYQVKYWKAPFEVVPPAGYSRRILCLVAQRR